MNAEILHAKLKGTGIPVAYMLFPEEEAPPLPFICYHEGESNNFYADGEVYFVIHRMVAELYSPIKDFELEKKIEAAISDYTWTKDTQWLEDEKCFETIYEMEM